MEAARRVSVVNKEVHRIRDVQSAAGASSFRDVQTAGGMTDSAVVDEDTTEGVQTTYVVGSGDLDPPAC